MTSAPGEDRIEPRALQKAAWLAGTLTLTTLVTNGLVAMLDVRSTLPLQVVLGLTVVAAFTVQGGYLPFLWVQRRNRAIRARCLALAIDDSIPFVPAAIWIYSGAYYVGLALPIAYCSTPMQAFVYMLGGVLLSLAHQVCFLLVPCIVPPAWRQLEPSPGTRWLFSVVRGIDNGRNCFPSLHVALCVYAGLSLWSTHPGLAAGYCIAVTVSCLLVRQHQLLDLPIALLTGLGAWCVTNHLLK